MKKNDDYTLIAISFCSLENVYICSGFEHGGDYQNTMVAHDAFK